MKKLLGVTFATLVSLFAFSQAQADLTLPNGKEIFNNHDNQAPMPCHPALFNEAYLASNFKGWGPWSATTEVRQLVSGDPSKKTAITYSDIADPPFSCDDELLFFIDP